ncbi:MAG: dockerin type I domain-containing protein, partial [Muribaculaceae bacterium]
VYFNRAMNIAKNPTVSYGVRRPYTQNTLETGTWSADSTVYSTKMKITGRESSDGICRFFVRGAEDNEFFECPEDSIRFNMILQAAGSMATGFMATPQLGRVELEWNNENNDFTDAMGFNVYRCTEPNEAGVADTIRLNKQMLEITTSNYVDYDVVPGTTYYYYYKVLSTDLKEYDMSNIVACTPLTSTLGDANGSGAVDVADVITVVNYSVGESPKPFIFEAADVNTDQAINILDVVGIVKLIIGNAQTDESGVAAVAQYSLENGTLYVDSPVELAGVQVMLNLPSGTNPTVATDLAGFETASASIGNGGYLFLAYSMSGKTLTAGRHALLHLGEGSVDEVTLSDRNGSNVLAIEANPAGVQTAEAIRIERPYPTPFVDTLNIPYVIGTEGNNDVEILIHNVVGRTVHSYRTSVNEAGRYSYQWTPGGIDPGFYFVTLRVNGVNCQSVKVVYGK